MKTKLEELKRQLLIMTSYFERDVIVKQIDELIAEQAENDGEIPYPKEGYVINSGAIYRTSESTGLEAYARGSIMASRKEAEEMLVMQGELLLMSRIKQRFCPDFVVDFDNRSQLKRRYEFDAVKKRWLGDTRYWTSMPATVWFAEESDTDVHAYLTRHYPEGFDFMRKNKSIYLCSFSSTAANLRKSLRHENGVLYTLKYHPRISTFDMSEKPWLANIVEKLERGGLIKRKNEPYPWHRWTITEAGERAVLKTPEIEGKRCD